MAGEHAPPDSDPTADSPTDGDRHRLFERVLPEVLKRVVERAIETGLGKITEAPENIRDLVGDLKLPKEAAHYLYHQIDDTKKGVYRVVAKEIRDVLEHTNFADEIADLLTKVSFEVSTTVRFVPNRTEEDHSDESTEGDDSTEGEVAGRKRPSRLPRPQVVSKVMARARDTLDKLSD